MGKLKAINLLAIIFIIPLISVSQEVEKFVILEKKITLNSPVVLYCKKRDGMFLVEEKDIEGNIKLDKLIKAKKAYLYETNIYTFMNQADLNKQINFQTSKECPFTDEYINREGNFVLRKFKNKKIEFIIGLINIEFYNNKIITVDNGKTYLSKNKNHVYYPIAFAQCISANNSN